MNAREEVLYHLWVSIPGAYNGFPPGPEAKALLDRALDEHAHELAVTIRERGHLGAANMIDPEPYRP